MILIRLFCTFEKSCKSIIIINDQCMDRWVSHYHFSCLWRKWNETRWTDKPIIFQSSHLFSWLLWKWDFSNFAWKLPLTFICTSFSDLDMFSRSHRSWTGKLTVVFPLLWASWVQTLCDSLYTLSSCNAYCCSYSNCGTWQKTALLDFSDTI